MAITLDRLTETYSLYKPKNGGLKEDYFAPLFLCDKFEKKIDDVLLNCAYGNNDYGIDAYYIDKDTRNLYLYQFKWSTSYDLFKESFRRLTKDGIERIFGNPTVDTTLNPLIARLRSELQEYQYIIDKIYICFVFNGETEKAESSKVLEILQEELESKKYIIDSFFLGREITLTIQYISSETKKINQTARTKKTYQYEVSFVSQSQKQAPNGEIQHIGFIKLYDLYRMFFDMKQRLFEKNIRAGLSEDNAPNQAIKKSLKDIVINKKIHPSYFTFHHNGITLFAQKLHIENGRATIIEPRVLNGAQTISTLFKFIEESQKNPNFEENQHLLKEIDVIGKIITTCTSEFVTQVTISNNKQNPVEPWNLRANDEIQCEFVDKFAEDGIYYERQENSFANLNYSELDELGITEQVKQIKIIKLAQTFLAFQGEINNISEMKKVFEMDTLYEKAFPKNFLKADTRKIILGYKIQYRLRAISDEIEARGSEKYYFVRYARNLIWALTIQGLLNDDNLSEKSANYGKTLSMEADFTNLLKSIASKKIRPILAELITQKRYKADVEQQKYSSLKTRSAFNDCMEIARKRQGWQMLKLTENN
jgi:AIPR protein